MNTFIKYFLFTFVFSSLLTACSKDDNDEDDDYKPTTSVSTNISAPTFAKNLTTTTTSDLSFRCRFDNGGDKTENMSCTVHWRQYSSKQSSTPKASSLSKHESMRQYGSTSKSTTFDKSHTGFTGGTYIYYYFECKNSKKTTKTDVTFTIIKR